MEFDNIQGDGFNLLKWLKVLVALVGIVLIFIGVAALAYIGYIIVGTFIDPASSLFIQWAQTNLPKDEIVLTLFIDEKVTKIQAAHTLQYLFYGFFFIMIVNAIIAVMKGIVSSGVQLIKITFPEMKSNDF